MASEKHPSLKGRLKAVPRFGARAAQDQAPTAAPVAVQPAAPPKESSTAPLERALDLLDALAADGPAPLTELATRAGCAPVTAARLLRVLQARGFATSDAETEVWRIGARWNAFSQVATEQGALAATAMPFLTALATAAGENAYLRVRDGLASETVALYQIDPALRVYSDVGHRGTLHAGTSRLLLAHAPEAVQTQILTQRLPRFTPATRTDATWIAADLQRIRARGYLISSDEVVAGAVSIAAPVRDASGQVIAVMFVSAPTMRMRPPRPRALVAIVQDAAAKLSHALGHTRTEPLVITPPAPRKAAGPNFPASTAMGIRSANQGSGPRV